MKIEFFREILETKSHFKIDLNKTTKADKIEIDSKWTEEYDDLDDP